MVVKRSGDRVPFDREKVLEGLRSATKNRPVDESQLDELVGAIEERLRSEGADAVTSERIGREVLEGLRELDRGGLPPLRQRLQGLRGPCRLHPRGRPAAQVHRAQARPQLTAAAQAVSSATASPNTSVWRSTSAAVWPATSAPCCGTASAGCRG